MASDAIRLTDIALYGFHGVTPAERQVGRLFEVDVELALDLSQAAETDDLGTTADYAAVYELVRRVHEAGPYQLLEALAGRIANEIMGSFPVEEVTVRVRKPHPPVGGMVGEAEVEITRRR
ncbi:MAG: dihydroneopterin aldolase [Armatimonadota bacterium]